MVPESSSSVSGTSAAPSTRQNASELSDSIRLHWGQRFMLRKIHADYSDYVELLLKLFNGALSVKSADTFFSVNTSRITPQLFRHSHPFSQIRKTLVIT